MVLYVTRQQTTKVLSRVRVCAESYASLLFAYRLFKPYFLLIQLILVYQSRLICLR